MLFATSALAIIAATGTLASPIFVNPQAPKPLPKYRSGNLTNIRTFTALGDSFASGVGAGARLGTGIQSWGNYQWECAQYANAYSRIVNDDETLGKKANRQFNFLSCSGHDIPRILAYQIPHIRNRSQDVITVSIGGNDLGFMNIADKCFMNVLLPSYADDACEAAFELAKDRMTKLAPRLDKVLSEIKNKLTPVTGRTYVNGYSNFFDTTTEQCADVTLSPLGMKGFLTKDKREGIKEVISLLNEEIHKAVQRAGEQFVYIDWDEDIANCGGRMCEAGIIEPAPRRHGAMFYQTNIVKGWIDGYLKPSHKEALGYADKAFSFVSRVVRKIKETIDQEKKDGAAPHIPPVDLGVEEIFQDYNVTGFLTSRVFPMRFTRPFHPKSAGQAVIAKKVLLAMHNEAAKAQNQTAPTSYDTCPLSKQQIIHYGNHDHAGDEMSPNFSGEVAFRTLFDLQLKNGKLAGFEELVLFVFGEDWEGGTVSLTDLIVRGVMSLKTKTGKVPTFRVMFKELFGKKNNKATLLRMYTKILGTTQTNDPRMNKLIDLSLSEAR